MLAAGLFVFSGKVFWPEACFVALGSIFGGYAGPWISRRVGPTVVRWFISVLGFAIGFFMLLR